MPKTIQVRHFDELNSDEWRVITAVETGMRNHEYVDLNLIHQLSAINFNGGSFVKILRNTLIPKRLIAYQDNGYRLTNLGYDYLALHSFIKSRIVSDLSNFRLIGTGKESDIYICRAGTSSVEKSGIEIRGPIVLKFHRLGRTSFKQVKNKREYKKGNNCSWIYMNRISSSREYATMKSLYRANLPVPVPLGHNRGAVAMEFVINSYPLFKFNKSVLKKGAAALIFQQAVKILIDMAQLGLVHGDLNEFNLLVETNSTEDHFGNYEDDLPESESDEYESEEEISEDEDEVDVSEDDEEDEDEDGNNCCPYINDDINSFKLRVIDFPQVISRDNHAAQEIYSRDRHGIVDFFSKFATLDEASLPPANIADIERTGYLDVELKAPGHPRRQELRLMGVVFGDEDKELPCEKGSNETVVTLDSIYRNVEKEKFKKKQKSSISKQQRNTKKGQFRNDIKFEM